MPATSAARNRQRPRRSRRDQGLASMRGLAGEIDALRARGLGRVAVSEQLCLPLETIDRIAPLAAA